MPDSSCAFCGVDAARELIAGRLAYATLDRYPLNPGHVLVLPRRHVTSWFETTEDERREMMSLLDEARQLIRQMHLAAGFNIGINDGVAAGQTDPHLQIHLIPRYPDDVADPRGGVRWIMPARAVYWKNPPPDAVAPGGESK